MKTWRWVVGSWICLFVLIAVAACGEDEDEPYFPEFDPDASHYSGIGGPGTGGGTITNERSSSGADAGTDAEDESDL
jgi:hypothetical protein